MMMSWVAEHEGAVGGERELRARSGAGRGAGAHHQLVHIGLELERFCTDGRRSRRGHEEREEKPSGTHLSASDFDGGHVARSR